MLQTTFDVGLHGRVVNWRAPNTNQKAPHADWTTPCANRRAPHTN
jgi:hypothetical protein